MMDFEHFESWLVEQGYRATTVRALVTSVRQIVTWADQGRELPKRAGLRNAAARLEDYVEDVRTGVWPDEAVEAAAGELLEGDRAVTPLARKRARQQRRQREARSFGDEEWLRLLVAIQKDATPEAAVLQVMVETGLRSADILRLSKIRLNRGVQTGSIELEVKGGGLRTLVVEGAPDAWSRLQHAWAGQPGNIVAEWVAPDGDGSPEAGGAAYQRLNRRLKALGQAVGIVGRVHLHRVRRTIGVQALRVSGDVPAVQQLMGHRSMNTTLRYLDEARPEAVGDLMRQVRERFAG